MKMQSLAAGLVWMIMACNQSQPPAILGSKNLPSTFLEIDPGKDTTIQSPKGATIHIPAHSLQSTDKTVKLELKEAYSMEDIVKGRLITISNGKPLSSGGMLYLAPVKQQVKILKPLTATIPTPFVNPDMILFQGETKDGDIVNWQRARENGKDSVPVIPDSSTFARLEYGRKLFHDNCATCHSLYKDLTGPSLFYSIDVMKAIDPNYPDLLYRWTRNNQEVLASGDPYFNTLFSNWDETPMNVFPFLTNRDLNALYNYIEAEKRNSNTQYQISNTCFDSCYKSFLQWGVLKKKREAFDAKNTDKEKRMVNKKEGSIPEVIVPTLRNGDNIDANRYQFNISVFGWQNVDMLVEDLQKAAESRVNVSIEGSAGKAIDIYLIVPSIRILLPGARWEKHGEAFYFLDSAKNLAFPPEHKAYIIAMTESGDEILFGKLSFITGKQQFLQLKLQPMTPEQINQQLNFPELEAGAIKANEAEHADEAKQLKKEAERIDSMKPKNCDCDKIFPVNQQPLVAPVP